jgi:hypothetical protein
VIRGRTGPSSTSGVVRCPPPNSPSFIPRSRRVPHEPRAAGFAASRAGRPQPLSVWAATDPGRLVEGPDAPPPASATPAPRPRGTGRRVEHPAPPCAPRRPHRHRGPGGVDAPPGATVTNSTSEGRERHMQGIVWRKSGRSGSGEGAGGGGGNCPEVGVSWCPAI